MSGICGTQVGDLGMASGNSTAVFALWWGAIRAITTIVLSQTCSTVRCPDLREDGKKSKQEGPSGAATSETHSMTAGCLLLCFKTSAFCQLFGLPSHMGLDEYLSRASEMTSKDSESTFTKRLLRWQFVHTILAASHLLNHRHAGRPARTAEHSLYCIP